MGARNNGIIQKLIFVDVFITYEVLLEILDFEKSGLTFSVIRRVEIKLSSNEIAVFLY